MKTYTIVSPYDSLAKNKIDELLRLCHITPDDMTSYDMQEQTVQDALFDVLSAPFLAERKAVLIKYPYFLTGSRQAGPEHDIEVLGSYLENPSKENVLIIHAPYEKLDERKKVVKSLKKKSDFIKLAVPNEFNLLDYAKQELTGSGITFHDATVRLLLDLTKKNADALYKELQKIKAYFIDDPNRELTMVLLRDLVPQTIADNVFLLTEALANKNGEMAYRVYADLMKQKEEPIKLLVMIANQFRLFKQVQLLQAQGMYERDIAAELGVHPYRVKVAMGQARRFRGDELDQVIVQLAEADLQVKTGRMDGQLALELFILGM
ncbi:MAG: DNA polymerase III subunit delta [Turicibacter sp.]|nr:DNA polymerase III subunit delta [Turicibacter sp.]